MPENEMEPVKVDGRSLLDTSKMAELRSILEGNADEAEWEKARAMKINAKTWAALSKQDWFPDVVLARFIQGGFGAIVITKMQMECLKILAQRLGLYSKTPNMIFKGGHTNIVVGKQPQTDTQRLIEASKAFDERQRAQEDAFHQRQAGMA